MSQASGDHRVIGDGAPPHGSWAPNDNEIHFVVTATLGEIHREIYLLLRYFLLISLFVTNARSTSPNEESMFVDSVRVLLDITYPPPNHCFQRRPPT